jgi:plastocyanin
MRLARAANPIFLLRAFCILCIGMTCNAVFAATVTATIVDKANAPMADVVIYATPIGATGTPPLTNPDPVTISQEGMQFSPYVTPVRVGTAIRFPNYDRLEHHVKSFSPAKQFEIKIYESGTPPPVVFDKPGVVVIYCLLHEWMRAYVLVIDTPYFSKSDLTGTASINGLKEGMYEIRAWHPDMGSIKPPLMQTIKVGDKGVTPASFVFDFLPKKRKPPKLNQVG